MTDSKIKQVNEPFIHITKRDDVTFGKSVLIHFIGLFIALVLKYVAN